MPNVSSISMELAPPPAPPLDEKEKLQVASSCLRRVSDASTDDGSILRRVSDASTDDSSTMSTDEASVDDEASVSSEFALTYEARPVTYVAFPLPASPAVRPGHRDELRKAGIPVRRNTLPAGEEVKGRSQKGPAGSKVLRGKQPSKPEQPQVVYSVPERGDIKLPLLRNRTPTLLASPKGSSLTGCKKTEELPLFSSSVNTDGEPCLETTFEGWKFAPDTQYYFHNGTHGVLKITISGPADDKDNFDQGADIMLMPGEAFQGKERYSNFVVTTPDGKRIDAKGKISQQTEARYRYFYYVNAENELKVVKGEMREGAAWSRWRPLELMVETDNFVV